jgi:D-alanyl-D-alanine carboxypeptidase/D-alanyl-D-alanine-endopeptidase (penicillin-binding protein 4)
VREDFVSSLAVAAMDGTVQRRFPNGHGRRAGAAQDGNARGVRALAGYVIDNEGRRFVVVAIVNHASAVRAQGAIDYLVQWVYRNGADGRRRTDCAATPPLADRYMPGIGLLSLNSR